MSYVKTQWVNGDTITADKLNHIEAGIEANETENSLLKSHLEATYITDSASGSIASFADGADGIPVEGLTVSMEPIQEGSGDPSPENIRPISGRESVTVTRAGVNVWDEEWEVGSYDTEGRPIIDVSRIRTKNRISVVGGTTYYMKAPDTLDIRYYDINDAFISGGYSTTVMNNMSVAPNRAAYLRFSVVGVTTYGNDISINYPATDTAYHPGTVASVEVQLGQTVYGGTVDVTSGVMVVDRAMVDLGTLNWTRYVQNNEQIFLSNIADAVNASNSNVPADAYCSMLKVTNSSRLLTTEDAIIAIQFYVSGIANINAKLNSVSTKEEFKAAITGQTLCYKLITPITVTLTPEQLTTVLGTNNIWSDADSVSVDYVADTKLYIEQLTEPDADMVADANITSGQYFMVGNALFLATANIASGGTISPGVNCTRTSLAEALNAINA